jgi:SAM-dependent methyltransferase
MSEEGGASVPKSGDAALADLASPPAAPDLAPGAPDQRADDLSDAAVALKRRPRTPRIPDDEVARPRDWAPAVVPTRIITINPPAPADAGAVGPHIPEEPPTPRIETPPASTLEDGWSVPSLPEAVPSDRGSSEDTLESLGDGDPSSPRVRAAVVPAGSPSVDPDGEEVRFDEDATADAASKDEAATDDAPTPALPRVEAAADGQGERRSEPGDAPEVAIEDLVAVEAAPHAAAPPPAPPAPKKVAVPPRPPLVIVPPHVGNMGLQSPESVASRRKGRLWWEDFFNDDYLRTTEKITDQQIAREVDFIEESLSVERGGAVLDLACGTGRHAVELGARGYEVVGFDLSLAMLARAGDDAQDRGVKLNFVQGDMRDMTFDEQFDGVFCWNTSFGYFEEERNAQVVDRVHRALKAGGLFLLDVINRDFLIRQSPSLAWFEGDGCVCMDEMIVDFITSRMRIKRTMMLDDGRTREVEYSLRAYSLHELGKILHEHGFKVCEVSGRPATPGVFFGNESPRTIILAEKR